MGAIEYSTSHNNYHRGTESLAKGVAVQARAEKKELAIHLTTLSEWTVKTPLQAGEFLSDQNYHVIKKGTKQ